MWYDQITVTIVGIENNWKEHAKKKKSVWPLNGGTGGGGDFVPLI